MVTQVINARLFRYNIQDVNGFVRTPGLFTNNTNDRNILLPRFERKDNQVNGYVYRIEPIVEFRRKVCVMVSTTYSVSTVVTRQKRPLMTVDTVSLLRTSIHSLTLTTYVTTQSLLSHSPTVPPWVRLLLTSHRTLSPVRPLTVSTRHPTRNIVEEVITTQPDSDGLYDAIITFEREHELNAVYSYTSLTSGSNYNVDDGAYYNIKLLSAGGSDWKGASATVVIVNKIVTNVTITDYGSGYTPGETLIIDQADIGSGSGATITIDVTSIENNADTIMQFTGGGSPNPDIYTFIKSCRRSQDCHSYSI